MRWLLILPCLILGCSTDTSTNEVARLGWSFNYRDWTKDECQCPGLTETACTEASGCTWDSGAGDCADDGADCTVDDIRDCTNQPGSLLGAPPYPAVTTVRVLLRDPKGKAPDWDHEVDCELGHNEIWLPIQGIARIPYRLTLEATSEDGTLLYDSEAPFDLDLTEPVEESFALRTPLGDLSFDAVFPGSGDACIFNPQDTQSGCPAGEYCQQATNTCDVPVGFCPSLDAVAFRYTLAREGEATPVLVDTVSPACELSGFNDILANKLYIRNIPVDPQAGATGGYLPTRFHVVVEALNDSDDVLFCGTSERAVNPGLNTRHDSQSLTADDCATWTCDEDLYGYGAGDTCDCECGLYDPDCDLPAKAVTGCNDFMVCEGEVWAVSSCACMDYFDVSGADCVWAGDTCGLTGDVSLLATEDIRELCLWMVSYAGGYQYEHDCGVGTVQTGGISECISDHTDMECDVDVIESCYDAIATGNPVADLCLLPSDPACQAYRDCLEP